MIFVTVGTQLAFDRMVGAVDGWAAVTGNEVFAQVGPTDKKFDHIQQSAFLEPMDFDHYFSAASLVIAHAGMGSILTALSYGKPIIIMPRKASLNEHRNEHQLATARRFATYNGVSVAWDENELTTLLHRIDKTALEQNLVQISNTAPESFIQKLRELINDSENAT